MSQDVSLADIEALIATTEKRAKLERDRLIELQEIRRLLEWLKDSCIEGDKSRARIEHGIQIIAEYMGADRKGDRDAMKQLAQQAKEVVVEVQSGGVKADGDISAGQDIAGRNKKED